MISYMHTVDTLRTGLQPSPNIEACRVYSYGPGVLALSQLDVHYGRCWSDGMFLGGSETNVPDVSIGIDYAP